MPDDVRKKDLKIKEIIIVMAESMKGFKAKPSLYRSVLCRYRQRSNSDGLGSEEQK